MDENRQNHAKLLPVFKSWRTCVWKTISFFEFANSRLSLKKIPLFAKIGTSMDIRFDREGMEVVVLGRFTNPYTKHMLKYHFQFFVCFVCSFFMSSLLSKWWGFMGHIPYGHFTGTFIFVAITILLGLNDFVFRNRHKTSQIVTKVCKRWLQSSLRYPS